MSNQKMYGKARRKERQRQAIEREDEARLLGRRGPIEAPVLWAGGWDMYLVDPTQIREMTSEELESIMEGKPNFYSPTIVDDDGQWLRCKFTSAMKNRESDTQIVKIVGHLGGGD